MGDQRGLPKKSNYFGGLGGLVGQDGQGDGGGHMAQPSHQPRVNGMESVSTVIVP